MKMNQSKENQSGCKEQTEKEENVMESIMNEFSEYICDHLCKYPEQIKNQEKLEEYCTEHCEYGRFHCAVLNEYNEQFWKNSSLSAYEKVQKYCALRRMHLQKSCRRTECRLLQIRKYNE